MNENELDPDELLTPVEAGQIIKRSVQALAIMRTRGNGPEFIKTGHLIRYTRAALRCWRSENSYKNTSEVKFKNQTPIQRLTKGRRKP